jgi:hypothetical protein
MNSRQIRDMNHAARKTGKTIIPKEGKLPKDTQHKEKPTQAKTQPKSIRTMKLLGTGFLAVLAVVGFAYQFRPEINADKDVSLNVRDPFSTQFRVTNEGLLAVYDLGFSCTVNNSMVQNVITTGGPGQKSVPVLESKESTTKNCSIKADSFPVLSDLFFDVTYTPKWFWRSSTKRTRFVNMRDSQGNLEWVKQPSNSN